MSQDISSKRIALGGVLLLCAAIAFSSSWFRSQGNGLGGDEYDYDFLARRIVAGHGFTLENGAPTALRTPGFPALLAAIYKLFDGNVPQARYALVILTSFTALAVYGISLLLFKHFPASLFASLGWAAMVSTTSLSGSLYGESLAGLCFSLSVFFSVLARKRESIALVCVAGTLIGVAILVRGYLVPVAIGPFVWLFLFKKRLGLAFIITAALIPSGWVTRNIVELKAATLSTQSPLGLWVGNNAWARGAWPGEWVKPDSQQKNHLRTKYPEFDDLGEVEQSRIFFREFINEVKGNPGRILWLIPRKVIIYLSPASYLGNDWVYALLFPLALCGTWTLWRRSGFRNLLWLIGFPVIGVMFVCVLTFGDSRFRHPVNPLIAVLSGLGVTTVTNCLRMATQKKHAFDV